MDIEAFHYLLAPEGQVRLSKLAQIEIDDASHLQIASQLSDEVGPGRAHALLETTLLRRHAAAKFTRAGDMYFTREALEQASAEVISTYRARRFARAGFTRLADLGCGIGGDALALAATAEVVGVEWDPLRLAMAQENVRAYERGQSFQPLQSDLLALSPLPVEALFADPGRRDEYGRRIYSVHQYRPPLSFLEKWREQAPHQAVKISPGVSYDELPPDSEVEFISVDGQVREAVLWYGALRSAAGRRATLLATLLATRSSSEHTLTDDLPGEIETGAPRAFLYEPDGAVIRAHLVQQLGRLLDAAKIDDDIAYLTADQARPTPFARCYALDDYFPFQLKRLRAYLRQRGIGSVTVKKRGSPLDPDELQRRLKLRGDGHCTIFLTKVQGQATVLAGRPAEI